MFRKITHIIVSLVLIISTAGVSISEHYCGNEVKGFSVNSLENPCCEIPSDCCHNEFELIQMKADFTRPTDVVHFNISEFHNVEFATQIIPIIEFVDNNSIIRLDEFYIPEKHDILLKYQSFLL